MLPEPFAHLPLVNSLANPRLKQLKKLITSRRERKQSGLMVLDGIHLLHSAVDHSLPLSDVFVAEQGLSNPEIVQWLLAVSPSRLTVFTDALFAELTEQSAQTSIMATIAIPLSSELDFSARPDCLLLDGVQDPGNLGSILRTAAAAGVTDVLLSAQCADPWSVKVLRAGMGAHFGLRIHTAVDLPDWLSTRVPSGYLSLATSLAATETIYTLDLTLPTIWVMGSEGAGVSRAVMALCNTPVLIPMAGQTESLNVGAATAICLFEQYRQRLAAKS